MRLFSMNKNNSYHLHCHPIAMFCVATRQVLVHVSTRAVVLVHVSTRAVVLVHVSTSINVIVDTVARPRVLSTSAKLPTH